MNADHLFCTKCGCQNRFTKGRDCLNYSVNGLLFMTLSISSIEKLILSIRKCAALEVCPGITRTDCDTENVLTICFQCLLAIFLNTHKYGSSHSNKWLDYLFFKRYGFNGELEIGNIVHIGSPLVFIFWVDPIRTRQS